MKKLTLFLPFLLLLSCSIQKRKYQNGYYVDWNHKKPTKESLVNKKNSEDKLKSPITTTAEIIVSTGDNPTLLEAAKQSIADLGKKNLRFFKLPGDSCDLIIFKDGSEVKAKVEEIGINEIKYKRCDSPDGPMYVSRKSDIFMIKYVNGTKEVFKTDPVVSPYQQQPSIYKGNKYKRVNHPLALPALILGSLSVFVGYLLGLYALSGGVVGTVLFIPLLLGIIAVALGITAINRIKEQPDIYKGKGMAVPGFIMGLVMACIFAIVLFFYFLFI